MENIVSLADYRKRREVRRAAPGAGARYFCTRCDSDVFKLSALGMVHCCSCGALMRNLVITPSSSQEADR